MRLFADLFGDLRLILYLCRRICDLNRCFYVAQRTNALYIYTKETIGRTFVGTRPSVTPSGKSIPYYSIIYDAEDLTQFFTDINITEVNGIPYLNALYKGKKTICERILRLDANRYQKGDLPLSNLLSKYCSYIVAGNRE
jgi:hypothetical protein